MLQRIEKFFRRDSQKGQGIVEYALILAFVAAIAAYVANDTPVATVTSTGGANAVAENLPNGYHLLY